jgi:hypothetical protein
MALSEKKIQEEMLKAERDRNKLLADIRDAIMLHNAIAINQISIKASQSEKVTAREVHQKCKDSFRDAVKESKERWEE